METMKLTKEVKNLPQVKMCIRYIRAMWDARTEKTFAGKVNWLDGMDKHQLNVLSVLFSQFAKGNETTKTFAIRLAGIK